jgi:nucleotide-binding universal stress UspA family protein
MTKLLIASDFSPASQFAYKYAAWLALQLKAQLIVVHVAPFPQVEETLSQAAKATLLEREKDQLTTKLQRFATPYPNREKPKLTAIAKPKCIVRFGRVIEQINDVATVEDANYLIIGTRSKHSFWDHLFGSVSTEMIHKTTLPLIIIPEGTTYTDIQQIAFATAITLEEKAVFPNLTTLATSIQAEIQSFYVNTDPAEQDKFREEMISSPDAAEPGNPLSEILMIRAKTVLQGIDYYLERHSSQMLALYVPDRQQIDRLLHRSVSKQAAYHLALPLLILKGAK